MAVQANKTISLKVIVEKEKHRVIFAESQKDFIDILFSFLTLPMGTIVRLVRKQFPMEEIGCMNKIYESVENCEAKALQTEACKTMLLWPRNAAEAQCKKLKLEMDYREPNKYYLCPSLRQHSSKVTDICLVSQYRNAQCECGCKMTHEIGLVNDEAAQSEDGGVFVKETARFMVSDDLHVWPLSTSSGLSLLRKLGVEDKSTLEERTLNLGVDEVLHLLKCSLLSKTPLTDLVFPEGPPRISCACICVHVLHLLECSLLSKARLTDQVYPEGSPQKFGTEKLEPRIPIYSTPERETETEKKKISLKLVTRKSKQNALYAEVGKDFVDLLFSFLTFPLGCMVELLGLSSSIGCINNLYASIQDFDADLYMKSEEHKAMLVSPKLAPDFGYENQPLRLQEAQHPLYYYQVQNGFQSRKGVVTCDGGRKLGIHVSEVFVLNPKSDRESTRGGGFVRGPAMFMVTDDLVVTPISPISGLSLLNRLKVPISDIEEQLLSLGEDEVLTLLKASLISKTALTTVFASMIPKEEEYVFAPTNFSDRKKPKQNPLVYRLYISPN